MNQDNLKIGTEITTPAKWTRTPVSITEMHRQFEELILKILSYFKS